MTTASEPVTAATSALATAAALHGADIHALPVSVARLLLEEQIAPLTAVETVALMQGCGRVLARDIIAPINVPAFDNAAMDGYAFNASALFPDTAAGGAAIADATVDGRVDVVKQQLTLDVAMRIFAGHPADTPLLPGQCARIMTGAVLPPGADTIIAHENATVADGSQTPADGFPSRVTLNTRGCLPGANRRLAGEDLQQGQCILAAGRILRASDIGLLASLGIARISVHRRLRVAFFSTGDELRAVGEPLSDGGVYDSNRYTLHAMLQRLGVEPIDLGVVRDDPAALSEVLRRAASSADAVISSGGVSAGDADFVRTVFAASGDVVFWKLAMRPGRPFAFGQLIADNASHTADVQAAQTPLAGSHGPAPAGSGEPRQLPFFGLPGNPVAVMATFYHLVRDALLRLMGASPLPVPRVTATAAQDIGKRAGRSEFARGIAVRLQDGSWQVALSGAQGSGILRSMSEANCFVLLEHERGPVKAGEPLDIMFFEGLI